MSWLSPIRLIGLLGLECKINENRLLNLAYFVTNFKKHDFLFYFLIILVVRVNMGASSLIPYDPKVNDWVNF